MQTKNGNFYEVNVKYHKKLLDGREKKVSEIYVVSAVNFTDVEATITSFLSTISLSQAEVKKINPAPYTTVYYQDPEDEELKWYRVKIAFITEDEKTGEEKRQNVVILVQAPTFDKALASVNEIMKDSVENWCSDTIQETKILGAVFN